MESCLPRRMQEGRDERGGIVSLKPIVLQLIILHNGKIRKFGLSVLDSIPC